jgi:secreted trypsin-like serine protease
VSSSACAACSPRATASSTTWLLCAGTAAGDTGPCTGDSGGPLVVGSPDAWLDVGVLTGGDSCAARGYFDLYARVDRISAFARSARLRPSSRIR